jgi:hypothetical protein
MISRKRHIFLATATIYMVLLCAATGRAVSGEVRAFSLREADHQLGWGESLNRDLRSLAGITRIAGMVFDRETRDVILVGKVLEGQPQATLDDLAVALRARLIKNQYPLVSIDMAEETFETRRQVVRFLGGIENTQFGSDFLESDIILKKYSLDLLQPVPGTSSYLKLYERATRKELENSGYSMMEAIWLSPQESQKFLKEFTGRTASELGSVQTLFWFYPMEDRMYVTERDDVYVIDELQLGVRAQSRRIHSSNRGLGREVVEKTDEAGERFASLFTEHLPRLYAKYPRLKRLKLLFDMVAISEGIAHLGTARPALTYLTRRYPLRTVETPKSYPLVERYGLLKSKEGAVAALLLTGGIELKAILLALEDGDPSALRKAVLASRPNPRALWWTLPLEEWKMPNDEPGSPQVARGTVRSGPRTEGPQKLASSIGVQGFFFPLPHAAAPVPAVPFKGFPPLAPMIPFNIPPPEPRLLNSLRPLLAPSAPPVHPGGVTMPVQPKEDPPKGGGAVSGVEMGSQPSSAGKGGSEVRDQILQSDPSGKSLYRDFQIPTEKKR